MTTVYLDQATVQGINGSTSLGGGVSETDLEQTVGVSMLADFNQQLADISANMQDQLAQKQELRGELSVLQDINGQTTVNNPSTGDQDAVEISTSERDKLIELGMSSSGFTATGQGGYYVTKDNLSGAIETKQEKMAGLNANSELTMLQIQSLVDQRKNMLMLLSNMMASKNETASSIIRNMKN